VLPSDGHLFYVEDLAAPTLDAADHHHAARVLRLREGEVLTLGDGAGRWRRARWSSAGPEVDGEVQEEPEPTAVLNVGFALVKGAKPELVVQKLTELGVDRILPFVAERSVVRLDGARSARAHERLVATARAAGMQSRRARLPEIGDLCSFADLVAGEPTAVLADRGGRAIEAGDRVVLVGPEGGWSAAERAAGRDSVAVADGVLRAETAAIAVGVVLAALRGGWVRDAG